MRVATESYHLRRAVLLICAVRSFINGSDLTVINNPVHKNSYLDFSTAVVIFLSRCDFLAEISAQKISAENTLTVLSCLNFSLTVDSNIVKCQYRTLLPC
jgi:hypothetical protein